MSEDEEATVHVASRQEQEVETGWELWVFDRHGRENRYPLRQRLTRFGPPELECGFLAVSWEAGRVTLFQEPDSLPLALFEGEPVSGREFAATQQFELGDQRLQLTHLNEVRAGSLQAYTEPYYGRVWNLPPQDLSLGRRGKRNNDIEINHPTVSRNHLWLRWRAPDFWLEAESPTLTEHNGVALEAGQQQLLHSEDLIAVGALLFRFRKSDTPLPDARLNLHTLGDFAVSWGEQSFGADRFPSRKCVFLLARLGLEWGKPCGLEALIEEFWPDQAERGRKNLNWTLTAIRKTLDREIFLRTSTTLQLDPDLLGEHDAHLILRSRDLRRSVELYRGPYLEGCYDEWACTARESILQSALEACRGLVAQAGNASVALEFARRGLELDPCCQDLACAAMASLLELGRAPEALRLFEQVRQKLWKELEVEPSIELLRYQLMAQSL